MNHQKLNSIVRYISQYNEFDVMDIMLDFDKVMEFFSAWDLTGEEKQFLKEELLSHAELNQTAEIALTCLGDYDVC